MARLERIDFEITSMIHDKIQKKRTAKIYYKAVGKHSTYKMIVKSLPCERIYDYLIMEMTKVRV